MDIEIDTKSKKIKKQIQNERLELSIREFLLCLLDLPMEIFAHHPYRSYRNIYRGYKKWRKEDRYKYYRMLYYLKKKELIIFDREEGLQDELPKLTEKGKDKARRYAVQEIDPLKPKTWDRKWRLVAFDVPNKKKPSREFVRRELKRIGFYPVQESLFVYPFSCKDEIEFIRLASRLSKYEFCYFRVDNFDLSPKALDYFIRAGFINPKEIKR